MKLPWISKRRVMEELDRLDRELWHARIEKLMFSHDGCPIEDGKVLSSSIRQQIATMRQRIMNH